MGNKINIESLSLNKSKTSRIIWTLLFVMPIIGMAVDLVTPSMPAISHDMSVSANLTKNIISIYLLGYAIGNFLTGFLTDAFGRKHLLRGGLFIFIISSFMAAHSSHISLLLVSRLLQGLSIGAVSVVV